MPLKRDKQAAQTKEAVPCAHETCILPARCRVQTAYGWANFCVPHYVRYHDDRARERFSELGLDQGLNETREAHKARVFAHIKRYRSMKTFADAVQAEDEWSRT